MYLVQDYMTKDPVCVNQSDSLLTVCKLMESDNFRHMPIVDQNRQVVGMMSERDLRNLKSALDILREGIEEQHGQLAVGEIMSRKVYKIAPEEALHVAAGLMNEYRIGALPVETNNQLVGIVTYTDILRAFIDLENKS